MVSLMLLTACASTKNQTYYVVKTVYKVPPLYFAPFPGLRDSICIPLDEQYQIIKDENETPINVIVPYWWIELIYEFRLNYDTLQNTYNHYKEIEQEYVKSE